MINVDLKPLIGRLNETSRRGLEAAAEICLSRKHYNLEVEHWLLGLLDLTNSDLSLICRRFEVDVSRLKRDLTSVLEGLKWGNARPAVLSQETVDLARDAWLIGSIQFGSSVTRSGHLICALLLDEIRAGMTRETLPQLAKVSPETLLHEFEAITAKSSEATQAMVERVSPSPSGAAIGRAAPGAGPSLQQFTVDITSQARAGRIDPVLGRDSEVRQIVDILMRRRQNNPILTGEAGVGKTAVVEGFAQRIVTGDVPPPLREVTLLSLDLGLLQAGASARGEFESRLRSVIDEVKASARPIILFIDEAHALVGAGGSPGQGDAANLLKPALARGELRTIAATTWSEYKKYFEKDPALTRRFQVVKIDEPTENAAEHMMRGLAPKLEAHHKVRIVDDAVVAAVRLSRRYVSGRYLPDKCVSLLDTACARVAIAHNDVPSSVEYLRHHTANLKRQEEVLARESAIGADRSTEIMNLQQQRGESQKQLEQLEVRWKKEVELVGKFNDLRLQLESTESQGAGTGSGNNSRGKDSDQQKATFATIGKELADLQGESPLVPRWVDRQSIAAVVADWTGIPVGRMMSDDLQTLLRLRERLEERIVGQSHALDAMAKSIRTARADLTDPSKPIGVFLLPGPSGVGKTETALALAELLYGGEQNITVINMSEFKEEHKVSLLMGSPPGYVGYGEGGVLTEAVRRKPYSVLLLDEMEKAHPGVQDIFYQVFDKGSLRDGEGRDINFKNTIIFMTSNTASDLIMKLCADPDIRPDSDGLLRAIYPELLKTYKPALLGRCTVIPYFPLSDEVFRKIVHLKLDRVGRRVSEHHQAAFTYTPELVDSIVARCTEVESGARNIDHILSRTLLPELSTEFLSRMTTGRRIKDIRVGIGRDGSLSYEITEG